MEVAADRQTEKQRQGRRRYAEVAMKRCAVVQFSEITEARNVSRRRVVLYSGKVERE